MNEGTDKQVTPENPQAVLPTAFDVVLSVLDDLNKQITQGQEQVKTAFEKLKNQSIGLTAQAALVDAIKNAVKEKAKQ